MKVDGSIVLEPIRSAYYEAQGYLIDRTVIMNGLCFLTFLYYSYLA